MRRCWSGRRRPAAAWAGHGGLGELPLEHRLRGTQQPLDPTRRRRLDLLLAAARQQSCPQPVPRPLHRADVGGQPHDQPVLIPDRRDAEPVEVADLRPVILDRAARPAVLPEQLRIDLHLARHELRRSPGNVFPPREPSLQLEELQQQGEPQTRRTCLVGQQLELRLIQRPALDEVLQLPLTPHDMASFSRFTPQGRKNTDS